MIHNGLGEIVIQPFEVDIYQSGFDQLCQAIDQAKAHTQAQVVLVGMEPTSHYFENLARHLTRALSAGETDQQLLRQAEPRTAAHAARKE